MANPKRRHSHSRSRMRRAHDALVPPGWSLCPSCFEPKPPHRVCPHCGTYKGRQVIEVEEIE